MEYVFYDYEILHAVFGTSYTLNSQSKTLNTFTSSFLRKEETETCGT